ncbi:nucleoside hydrolase [Dongshaea marina]|uniref:nucleoside hydrolase n=1 Tax=Dongshaea marina TaxID=2047966 RepID=UPI000D3ECBCF|nr:nucleoside hydrolase [Dongshaea marina]
MIKKIIIDTDPGIDDAFALLFAKRHPQLQLMGITTVAGNASVEQTTHNALFLKEQFKMEVPVCQGAAVALHGEPHQYPAHIHGHNGLGDIEIPQAVPELHSLSAVDFLIQSIMQHPGEITLVTLGQLTNLALALERQPEIASLVKEVVVMGGALGYQGHQGNLTPVAEANIGCDPEAAEKVFAANWPLTLVGLDVTNEIWLDTLQLNELADKGGAEGELLATISGCYADFYHQNTGREGVAAHDVSAIAYLVAAEHFETKQGVLRVVTQGWSRGQTQLIVKNRRLANDPDWCDLPEKTACIGVDSKRLNQILMETLLYQ